MARTRVPSYRLHRPSGQAVVTIGGRDHYLGKHGTEASRRAYDALVGRWQAGGRTLAKLEPEHQGATVDEVIAEFLKWAQGYYRKGGRPTSQFSILRPALRTLHELFGDTPAAEFAPSRLKALRQAWVDAGVSRVGVNRKVGVVRQVFSWGVEHEMVPGGVAHALRAVRELAPGRTTAPERPRVLPVPDDVLEKTLPHLKPREAAMVRLQLASGMRPGEACLVRPCDLDRSVPGAVWVYRPHAHKTEHRGKDRVIYLGPEAQAVLAPWLTATTSPGDYLFRPGGGSRWARSRPLREATYCREVAKACDRAGVPRWAPNRLRHNAATRIRAHHGVEAARIILGHSKLDTTTIYAERDEETIRKVVEETG